MDRTDNDGIQVQREEETLAQDEDRHLNYSPSNTTAYTMRATPTRSTTAKDGETSKERVLHCMDEDGVWDGWKCSVHTGLLATATDSTSYRWQ